MYAAFNRTRGRGRSVGKIKPKPPSHASYRLGMLHRVCARQRTVLTTMKKNLLDGWERLSRERPADAMVWRLFQTYVFFSTNRPACSPLGIVRCAGAHRLDQSIIQPSTSKPYRRVARVMTAYSDFYYGCARTVRKRTNWTDSAHCTQRATKNSPIASILIP